MMQDGRASMGIRSAQQWVENTGTATIDDGTWHHVAGMRMGDMLYLYVDGKESGRRAAMDGDLTINTIILIGGFLVNDELFDGMIDEVRIYNRALSRNELEVLAEVRHWNVVQ
jgi:beta-galactosidase